MKKGEEKRYIEYNIHNEKGDELFENPLTLKELSDYFKEEEINNIEELKERLNVDYLEYKFHEVSAEDLEHPLFVKTRGWRVEDKVKYSNLTDYYESNDLAGVSKEGLVYMEFDGNFLRACYNNNIVVSYQRTYGYLAPSFTERVPGFMRAFMAKEIEYSDENKISLLRKAEKAEKEKTEQKEDTSYDLFI